MRIAVTALALLEGLGVSPAAGQERDDPEGRLRALGIALPRNRAVEIEMLVEVEA